MIDYKIKDKNKIFLFSLVLFTLFLALASFFMNLFLFIYKPDTDSFLLSYSFLADCIIYSILVSCIYVLYRKWKKAKQKIKELQYVLSGINPDVLLLADSENKIMYISNSIENVYGHKPKDLIGKSIGQIFSERKNNTYLMKSLYHDVYKKHGYNIFNGIGLKTNGDTIHLEIIKGNLEKLNGSVYLLRDISLLKKTHVERDKLREILHDSEKLFLLGQLSKGVEAELREPATMIDLNVQYLKDMIDPESVNCQEALESIEIHTNRVKNIIDGLSEYSEITDAKFQQCDFTKIINETLTFFQNRIEKKRILIDKRFDSELPELYVDSNKISIAISNLIDNAMSAMDDYGTLRIHAYVEELDEIKYQSSRHVSKYYSPGDQVLVCEIEDTGMGISKENINNIFNPFFTRNFGENKKGLGLTIVKSVIENYNGLINVESKENVGTTFKLVLPLDKRPTKN
ncbi:MAG: ATP-binding protein [Pseudomonadota bacterium]